MLGRYQGGVTLGQPGGLSGDSAIRRLRLMVRRVLFRCRIRICAGPFTIELWAFLKGSGSTGAVGYATLAGYDWTHRLLWSTGNGSLLAQFDGNFFSTASASLNAWHQIVYSFDGSAEHFYIDGVPAGSHPTTLPRWQSPFYLGAYDLNNYMFNGRLDDAAVYSKALTAGSGCLRITVPVIRVAATTIVGATSATYSSGRCRRRRDAAGDRDCAEQRRQRSPRRACRPARSLRRRVRRRATRRCRRSAASLRSARR